MGVVVRRTQQAAGLREAERFCDAAHAARLPDARHEAIVGRQLHVRQACVDHQLKQNKLSGTKLFKYLVIEFNLFRKVFY